MHYYVFGKLAMGGQIADRFNGGGTDARSITNTGLSCWTFSIVLATCHKDIKHLFLVESMNSLVIKK